MTTFEVYNSLVSKVEYFKNYTHFCQDIKYTVTLKGGTRKLVLLEYCTKPIFVILINYRIDKRKSFVFPRQYRNCLSRTINALLLKNQPIRTAVGIVIHDFHGLKAITFHHVADIAYFWFAVMEIIQFLSLNVAFENCCKTKLKTGQIQERECFEILGSKHG